MNILVIGDIMFDRYIYGDANRVCPEAPVPILNVNWSEFRPGGAANVAANLLAMDDRVALVGMTGNTNGEEEVTLYQLLSHKNCIGGVVIDSDRTTTIKTRYVSNNRIVLRTDDEDTHMATGDVEKKLIDYIRRYIAVTDIIIISDYGKGVITPNICETIYTLTDKPIIIDPKPSNAHLYEYAHTITPNLQQAELMMGPGFEQSEWPHAFLARNLIVTNGEKGASIFRSGGIKRIDVDTILPPAVVDITGAGDVFIAVYAHILAHIDHLYTYIPDEILKQIVHMACIIASRSVYHFGTWTVDQDSVDLINIHLNRFYEQRSRTATRTMYGHRSV